jgi:hypothetical protein
MALFTFKTRNPHRDRDTDELRLKLLADSVAEISRQIKREKTGLNARYTRVSADAAFSLQALENQTSGTARLEELTRSMARSRSRLTALDAQLALLLKIQQQINDFVNDASREMRDEALDV